MFVLENRSFQLLTEILPSAALSSGFGGLLRAPLPPQNGVPKTAETTMGLGKPPVWLVRCRPLEVLASEVTH